MITNPKAIIVFYRKDSYNPYIHYPQCANRYAAEEIFYDRDEAKAFCETHNVTCITNGWGKKIEL